MNAPSRPPNDLEESRALLAGFLNECRDAVAFILAKAKSEPLASARIEYTLAAARMMRTGAELFNALDREKRLLVVEHHRVTKAEGHTPQNPQTISSAAPGSADKNE